MSDLLQKIRSIGLSILVACASIGTLMPTHLGNSGMERSGTMRFYLTRTHRSKTATLGAILLPDGRSLRTLEPSHRLQGKPRSIPAGIYVVEVLQPRGTGLPRLHLRAVEGFSNVYIEVGNFPRNTRGCVLVGLSAEGEELRDSRKAYQALLDSLGSSKDFILVISDVTVPPH